jgi:hypothetical protein
MQTEIEKEVVLATHDSQTEVVLASVGAQTTPECKEQGNQTFKRDYGTEMKKIKEFELLYRELRKFPSDYLPSESFMARVDLLHKTFYEQIEYETEPTPLNSGLFYWDDPHRPEAELSSTRDIVFRTNAAPKSASTFQVLQTLQYATDGAEMPTASEFPDMPEILKGPS